MVFEWISHIRVEWLSFLALVGYVYLTWLIARDIYNPLVSFHLKQHLLSHLNFSMENKSKVEVEVFGKLWSKLNGELFEFRDGGFYDDKRKWILQPFTVGYGHFDLKELKNNQGINLQAFIKENKISSIKFNMQIKYRKTFGIIKKWKKTSAQNFIYNFDQDLFWLNV